MAGLYLWHTSKKLDSNTVNEAFSSLEYKRGKYLQMGDWNAVVFPKAKYKIKNWLTFEEGSICGVGTFGYKGKVYDQALPIIYDDFAQNQFDTTAFWGSFIILVYSGGKFSIIRDGACLTRLYALRDNMIFSTSLSGMIAHNQSKMTLDKDAATELLISGVLTGSRTLVKEIQRIINGQKTETVKIIETTPLTYKKPNNREEALDQQINITKDFFHKVTQDWLKYMPDGVTDVGITGGMDSRLVATLALNSQSKIVLHTHWRKAQHKDKDYHYANLFAEKTGMPLHIKKVIDPTEMTSEQLQQNFEQAYRLSDGVFRPGIYWDEVYSTFSYRSGLTTTPYLRYIGFGGEQYRNGERLPLKSMRSLKSWIKWEMNYQFAGRYFTSKKAAQKTEGQIRQNIVKQLGKVNFNLLSFKEYIRLIQSTSYRSLQSNMENRLGFCLNPFLDTNLSVPSLLAVPFLGKSLGFQLEMINRISPEIAAIPNGYGFDFRLQEPLKLKIAAIFWQFLLPWIKHPVYAKLNNHFRTDYIPKMAKKHEFIRELEEIVLQLNLPIDFAKHRLVRSRSRLMLNLGYFLKRNNEQLQF